MKSTTEPSVIKCCMPKKLNFELNETELVQITKASRKNKRPEVRQRAQAIRMLASGQKPAQVAESLDVHPATIYSWFHRYRQDGLEGLANRPRGRTKRKIDETYCQALELAIEHDPGDYGYPFEVWTVERLRDHLQKETGAGLSISRLRAVIREEGYIYRRTRHKLTDLQYPDAQERTRGLLWITGVLYANPTKVLLGYFLLVLVMLLLPRSLLLISIATLLALFGPGYSLLLVLLPKNVEFDLVERVGLSAGLSLAVIGFIGFFLARSIWGLNLVPFLVIIGLFNLGCSVVIGYKMQERPEADFRTWSDLWEALVDLPGKIKNGSHWITIVLLVFLVLGAWNLSQSILKSAADPPMTEFYLLDPNGLAQDFPESVSVGEPLNLSLGIVNRESETAQYKVQVLVNGILLNESEPVSLNPGEATETQIELILPDQEKDPSKIDFFLYREDRLYRLLHIFLNIEKAEPLLSSINSTWLSGRGIRL